MESAILFWRPSLFFNYHAHYRNIRRAIWEYQAGLRGTSDKLPPPALSEDNVLRVTLSRLKKNGFVENNRGVWSATEKGKDFIKRILRRKQKKELAGQPKNLIIAFDIPERYARKRCWLRLELKSMGFTMLQKSVWFGPGPLPEEFVQWLKETNLLGYMKFFRAASEEIV